MNFLNLSYFLVAAQELNFTRAAQKLYISQQTLSNHIHRLEVELDTTLFERTPTQRLTPSGKALEKFAKQVLFLQSQFNNELHEIKEERVGELTIGCTRTRARVLLPRILPLFHEMYPQITLNAKLISSKAIAQELSQGAIDVIICVHRSPINSNVKTHILCEDKFCLVVPQKIMKRLFPDNTEEMIEKYTQEGPNLLMFKNEGFLISGPSRVRDLTDRVLGEAGIVPKILLEGPNMSLLLRLCCSGMGITLSYEMAAEEANRECMTVLNAEPAHIFPINIPGESTHVIIGYNKERFLDFSIKSFVNLARQAFGREEVIEWL